MERGLAVTQTARLEGSPLIDACRDECRSTQQRTVCRHHWREEAGAVESPLEKGRHEAKRRPGREVPRREDHRWRDRLTLAAATTRADSIALPIASIPVAIERR